METMQPLALNTLKIAQSQIGVEEVPRGSNAGTDVEKYLKNVGLGKGYSWCMAFVYWCVSEASKQTKIANPLKKTAGVLDQLNSRKAIVTKTPMEGCIFIMDFGKGKGHTGFVEKILPNGSVHTIEGNTNDEGSREGYEVCRRTRKINTITAFLKIE